MSGVATPADFLSRYAARSLARRHPARAGAGAPWRVRPAPAEMAPAGRRRARRRQPVQAPRRTSATVAALMLSLALIVAFAGMARASYDSIVYVAQHDAQPRPVRDAVAEARPADDAVSRVDGRRNRRRPRHRRVQMFRNAAHRDPRFADHVRRRRHGQRRADGHERGRSPGRRRHVPQRRPPERGCLSRTTSRSGCTLGWRDVSRSRRRTA